MITIPVKIDVKVVIAEPEHKCDPQVHRVCSTLTILKCSKCGKLSCITDKDLYNI